MDRGKSSHLLNSVHVCKIIFNTEPCSGRALPNAQTFFQIVRTSFTLFIIEESPSQFFKSVISSCTFMEQLHKFKYHNGE